MAQHNVDLTPEVAKALIYRMLRETIERVKFKKSLHAVYLKERYPQHVVKLFDEAYQEFIREIEDKAKLPGEK